MDGNKYFIVYYETLEASGRANPRRIAARVGVGNSPKGMRPAIRDPRPPSVTPLLGHFKGFWLPPGHVYTHCIIPSVTLLSGGLTTGAESTCDSFPRMMHDGSQ